MNFTPPAIDYAALSPMIVIFAAAIVSVLVEAFAPRAVRRFLQLLLVFGALITSGVLIVLNAGTRTVTGGGAVVIDGPALVLMGTIVVLSILGAALMAERTIDPVGDSFAARASSLPGSEDERQLTQRGYLQTEIWPLTLFAVLGMLLFVTANNLLLMFVALEIISLPLYLMTGMARRRRLLSQEASLKYFLLGVFASAFYLYGAALVYGYSGSIFFPEIAQAIASKPSESIVLFIGMGMLIIGPLFKIGAVPFHQWVPDVYQGAPTAVVGFMAATVKVAAFGALLRILYVAFGGVRWDWDPLIWIIATASMIFGSIVALMQTDIKRLLGYSWIAQAGFILVGLAAASPAGLESTMFYVIAYGFATIGTFAVITMVRDANGEATNLAAWAGLGRKSPLVASALSLFLLGLAGIPLTSGFVSKFAVFVAAIEAGSTWLVIVGVLASVIAAFFYVRIVVIMFFSPPTEQTASVAVPSAFTTVALSAGVAVTLLLGVFPQPVLDMLSNAGLFLR
ncbi:MAG TPA: NADH-quinone oxidoreductase subunit NuoN [Candidatus Nanopelagicales bacterium]|nr:NADH-quinone oxidoreductase subunit NuoN [Candidatus Nanopelagicales bacterium]